MYNTLTLMLPLVVFFCTVQASYYGDVPQRLGTRSNHGRPIPMQDMSGDSAHRPYWLPDNVMVANGNPLDYIQTSGESNKRTVQRWPTLSPEQRMAILKELENRRAMYPEQEEAEVVPSSGRPSHDIGTGSLSFGTDLDALSVMIARGQGRNFDRLRSVKNLLTKIGK